MTDLDDLKMMLRHYLQEVREALLWKCDGLSERDLRLPRTPTGTNLLGIVKHCLNVEVGYFGPAFGRPWPTPEEVVSDENYETDPQADWYATRDETAQRLVDLYRRVWVFADQTISSLPLDAPGRVPWWQGGTKTSHFSGSSPTSPVTLLSTPVMPTSCVNRSTARSVGDLLATASPTSTGPPTRQNSPRSPNATDIRHNNS